jgi:hypothetical protein
MTKKCVLIDSLEQVKKTLEKRCSCYVLLTCTEPSQAGEMQVEMHFDGDEDLAALLVQHATGVFEGREDVCKQILD